MTYLALIANTSEQFTVEEGETLLAAALGQGVDLPWGCGSGICGTCMGDVVSGEVYYPDGMPLALFETDAQQGKALLCSCCAKSDLVLYIAEKSR